MPLLGPTIPKEEFEPELRQRKRKEVFQTVTGPSRAVIAKKVDRETAEGWKVAKKNVKSTRMSMSKSGEEQLEDELWCILARMGFNELSKGRDFQIATENGEPPHQVDIFAKDDEIALTAECAFRNNPGKQDMAALISDVQSNRESVLHTIQSHYGSEPKLKLKPLIASRNISWSQSDLTECARVGIAVITDKEIDYYTALVQHLKHAARYQFLAHMFEGKKVSGLAKQVLATQGKMGNHTFYTFLARPEELLKISYVGHKASRDIENLETYQRMLQPKRLRQIAKYINNGGKFPTNIVINFKTRKRTRLKFDEQQKLGEETLGVLHLPANYASAWIIDGQHRLYGYAQARENNGFENDKSTIPVLAYENLPVDKEMDLFIDINSKQVKVSTGLLVELYSDLHWKSSNTEEAFQALLSRVASRLNSEKTSPLFERMVVSGRRKTRYRCLTQTSIRDGLIHARLLGSPKDDEIKPGPLSTVEPCNYEANLTKSLAVLTECLRMCQVKVPAHWDLGDASGGYLCTNNGIRALLHVIKDLSDHIAKVEEEDLCLLSAEDVVDKISPYLNRLTKFFASASSDEIRAFRGIGSSLTAVRQQSYGMEAHIREEFKDFQPAGLQEYLDSRDAAGTDEAAKKVTEIHRRLFNYVICTLKRELGTENKQWWTKGIPKEIRKECSAAWEEKDREGEEESNLHLISYIKICRGNWPMFKDVISLGERDKDNSQKCAKWIGELNEIRKITAHPERGILSKDQVDFVNNVFVRVEQHLPNESG